MPKCKCTEEHFEYISHDDSPDILKKDEGKCLRCNTVFKIKYDENDLMAKAHSFKWCEKCKINHYYGEPCIAGTSMDKFEYMVIQNVGIQEGTLFSIEREMNKFGEAGWELCGIKSNLFYFKRKIDA